MYSVGDWVYTVNYVVHIYIVVCMDYDIYD